MDKLKTLVSNISLLNILLILLLLVVLLAKLTPLMNIDFRYVPLKGEKGEQTITKAAKQQEILSSAEYANVADVNLFHPERIIPPEKKEEQPLPKPDFILYGTMMTDETGIAYLEDRKAPRKTPGRGMRQIPLRKGDALSGFSLREIFADRVIMSRGEETLTVRIHENKKQPIARGTQSSTATPAAAARKLLQDMKQTREEQLNARSVTEGSQIRPKDQKVFDMLEYGKQQ